MYVCISVYVYVCVCMIHVCLPAFREMWRMPTSLSGSAAQELVGGASLGHISAHTQTCLRHFDPYTDFLRHFDPYPAAVATLEALEGEGHDIVIITAKPDWAIPDTFRWLADHRVPTREVHMQDQKYLVECDVYLDDSPHVVPELVAHRPSSLVCRFVRPWNDVVEGSRSVHSWGAFHEAVTECSRS